MNFKKKLFEEYQSGAGRLNPLFLQELSQLKFVVGDQVLGDDVRIVILSLIEEFNRIAVNDLKYNLELSQYYALGPAGSRRQDLMTHDGKIYCENCELVLKYVDTTVCLSQARERQIVTRENDKYYLMNQTGKKVEVDCSISRGLVRFYIKEKEGDSWKYTLIRVVRVQKGESLQPFLHVLYQDNDEIRRLETATHIAVGQAQMENIRSISEDAVSADSPENIVCAINMVDGIIGGTKEASVQPQLAKMRYGRFLSTIPAESAIASAQVVARQIMLAGNKKESPVLVPGNEPIPIQSDMSVKSVPATIDQNGTRVSDSELAQKKTTISNKSANTRASIAVDADVAVVPSKEKTVFEKVTDFISDAARKINQVGDIATEAVAKVDQAIKGKASVVQVSPALGVLTTSPEKIRRPNPENKPANLPVPEPTSTTIASESKLPDIVLSDLQTESLAPSVAARRPQTRRAFF